MNSKDTFCIHPWNRLRLQSNGSASVCCQYNSGTAVISDGGSPMSIERDSLAKIWNSEEMRSIRRAMVDGQELPGCSNCYAEEAKGVISMRIRDNKEFEGGFLNETKKTIDQLKSLAVSHDFQLPGLPASIEVDTGSLCNLKCRMCTDDVSSRIAADPVHSSWTADRFQGAYHDETAKSRHLKPMLFDTTQNALELAFKENPGQVKRLYFIGGEPLMVRGVGELLKRLVEAGDEKDTELALVSNGSLGIGSWLPLTKTFKRMNLAISIDGFDEHYDYIRYPAKWRNLARNLVALKEMAHVSLGVSVTIQAYNALRITDLFRYLDAIGIGFFAYPIHFPRYLTLDVMPSAARLEAAKRLTVYADHDCRPQHLAMVQGLINEMKPINDQLDEGLVREFMLFTNDLDATRRQRIHDVDGELVSFFEDAGFPWSTNTLHAPSKLAPKYDGGGPARFVRRDAYAERSAALAARGAAYAERDAALAARDKAYAELAAAHAEAESRATERSRHLSDTRYGWIVKLRRKASPLRRVVFGKRQERPGSKVG